MTSNSTFVRVADIRWVQDKALGIDFILILNVYAELPDSTADISNSLCVVVNVLNAAWIKFVDGDKSLTEELHMQVWNDPLVFDYFGMCVHIFSLAEQLDVSCHIIYSLFNVGL